MQVSDFDYYLPESLIAQTPIEPRDMSRLMCLDKNTGEIQHKIFHDIVGMINPGDCLVINNSKVLPARLYGKKIPTGGAIEFVLLKQHSIDTWEVILKPGRKAQVGSQFEFGDGQLTAEILEIIDDGNRIVKFKYEGSFFDLLDKIGNMPLPPYIKKKLEDKNRYQTVYAKTLGSAAAPTAGLHFTKELLQQIKEKDVKIAQVTLHIGLGTFRPVKVKNVDEHKMHTEYYEIPQEAADIINKTKASGKRVICVGTTSCRTIESAVDENGMLLAKSGNTGIFIYPGYQFKILDALITNFHLPQSTLLMLVSALAGRENILSAYEVAVKEQYRFFSFGDAMFIH